MPPAIPNGESGPDFTSFGGGAGAAGGIIGTNQLQSTVDKFAQAVAQLDSIVTKMGALGGGGRAPAGGGGTGQVPGGFPQMVNPFSSAWQAGPSVPYPRQGSAASPNWFTGPNGGGQMPEPLGEPVPPAGGMPPPLGPPGGPVFTNTGRMGGSNGGGPPTVPLPAAGGAGGGGGGGFTAAGAAGAAAGGLGAGGGIPGYAARTALSYAPAPVAAVATGIAASGSAEQTSQIMLNTLQYQSALGGQNYTITRTGAFGTAGNLGSLFGLGGSGQMQNEFSLNPADAAAGYALLQQATRGVNPYGTQYGAQNVLSTMGGLNLANPALSEVQNAGALQALYSPQTSLRMMMMGYPVTPTQAGTGNATGSVNLFSPLLNRLGGGKPISQQQLFSLMQPGQRGYTSLANLTGGTPQQVQQYANMIEMQNALMVGANGQPRMTAEQAQQVLTNAASSNVPTFKSAQSTLARYGFPQSDMASLKAKAGTQEQNISDTSQGFTNGLQAATRALSDFNTVLHKIINSIPGERGFLGSVTGFISNVIGGGARTGQLTTPPATHAATPVTSGITGQAKTAVADAETQLGVPYVWGGESPGVGFDCSGLVQWAYKQAGVDLPRTSQQQWAALKGSRAVNVNQAEEGDLIFLAGSDGTTAAPGHVAMMVNSHQFIEAQQTGVPVHIKTYNPRDWLYAARPTGSLKNGGGTTGTATTASATNPPPASGSGLGGVSAGLGDYATEGSTSELSAFGSAIMGGGLGGSPTGSTAANTTTAAAAAAKTGTKGTTAGGTTPNLTGNKAILNAAAAKFGWGTGAEWTALNALEMQEAGYNNLAQNPTSTAFGMGQFLDSTWAPYGPKTSNAALQAKYMMEYIRDRYHDPIAAEAHELADHWYAAGGQAAAGSMAWVGERGPELVSFTQDATVHTASQSARLMKSSMAKPAEGPWAAGAGASYVYSQAHPIYGGGQGGTGLANINFAAGSIVISGGNGMTATGNSGMAMAQTFTKQLKSELGKLNLAAALGSGVTS